MNALALAIALAVAPTPPASQLDSRPPCEGTVVTVHQGDAITCDLVGGQHQLNITGLSYPECLHVGGRFTLWRFTCVDADF